MSQEPLFEMPQLIQGESLEETLTTKNEIGETEWPELITDCLCVMGLAGINHVKGIACNTDDATDDEPTLDDVNDIVTESRGRGRPPKQDHELGDPISAGRKRAAAKVKIKAGTTCEWAFLKYAGGGVNPILGCTGYSASALHHGPDKSTLNNSRPEDVGKSEPYNLHAICVWCHNRWHVANDKYYGNGVAEDRPLDNSEWVPDAEFKLHDPVTEEEQVKVFMVEMERLKREKREGNDYSEPNSLVE